jgi:hypothetical protein
VLPESQIDDVLDLRKMTEIGIPGESPKPVAAPASKDSRPKAARPAKPKVRQRGK